MKKYLLLLFICLGNYMGLAQAVDYTGVWNGKFYDNTSSGLQEEQYRFEVQIAQTGKGLEGVTYSYLNTTFYGKATHNGFIKSDGKKLVIQETKLVEVKSMGGGACLMTCTFKYSKVGNDEFLEGTFTAVDYQNGGPCDGGYVILKKVQKSIFGIDKKVQAKLNEINKRKVVAKPITKPPIKPIAKPPVKPVVKPPVKPVVKPPVKPIIKPKPPIVSKPIIKVNKDSLDRVVAARKKAIADSLKNIVRVAPPKRDTIIKPRIVTPPIEPIVIRDRTTELVQTIDVEDTVEHVVKFYDYGDVDGDIVTIYVNNQLVISKRMLGTSPIEVPLKLDRNKPEVLITMVADNLGSVPPNTAFMVVYVNGKRHEAKIESTEQKNASIKFVYNGK
jgi:hypothetical protein